MRIGANVIGNYGRGIDGICDSVAARLLEELSALDTSDATRFICEAIAITQAACDVSAEATATFAASFYDALRDMQIGELLGAEPVTARNEEATERAIRAISFDGDTANLIESVKTRCIERVEYEGKRAAGETVIQNARKDPARPKYARVPSGVETCDFCLMLASRGFVYASKKTAGDGGHYHANCKCRIVPSFGDTKIEGYDPDKLYDMWKHPEKYDKTAGTRINYDDVDSAFVPEKLSGYSMNPEKAPEKAAAWNAIGYTLEDAETVEKLILNELPGSVLTRNGYNGYGALYYVDVFIPAPKVGKARVRASWISKIGSDEITLTSVYVKKSKGGAKDGN